MGIVTFAAGTKRESMIRCAKCRNMVVDAEFGGFDEKGYPVCKRCVSGTAESND